MKKFLFLTGIITVYNVAVFSQVTDNLKIDSLEKLLLYLKDSTKVDCLNLLARKFAIFGGAGWTWGKKADSVFYYGSMAYEEASKINYKRGVAAALFSQANSEWLRGIDLRKNNKDDAEILKEM